MTQATMDQISRQVHDKDILELFNAVRRIRKKHGVAEPVRLRAVEDADLQFQNALSANGMSSAGLRLDRDYIINLLNYYESWAIGIDNGALDESPLKDWWRSTYVAHYVWLQDFVQDYRDQFDLRGAYDRYQHLASKWANDDERARILVSLKDV